MVSNEACKTLVDWGITPGQFIFRPGEVRVGQIARHFEVERLTGTITADWFVVFPHIRSCRELRR